MLLDESDLELCGLELGDFRDSPDERRAICEALAAHTWEVEL